MINLSEVLADFYQASSSEGVTFYALTKLANGVGFRDVIVNEVVLPQNTSFVRTAKLQTTFSESWQQQMRDLPLDIVQSDPILAHLQARSDPIVWDQLTYGQPELYDLFAANHICSGIAVAVETASSKRLFIGFSGEERSLRESPHVAGQLAALMLGSSLAASVGAGSTKTSASGIAPTCPLSTRELEVLRWVRDGKSSWDIGAILGISEETVSLHAKNINKKLGVRSRMQAVLLAARSGWIS
jgi:DNA-binding CsgD family transcriptional regulator